MNPIGRHSEQVPVNGFKGGHVFVWLLILAGVVAFVVHLKQSADRVNAEILSRSSAGDMAVALERAM